MTVNFFSMDWRENMNIDGSKLTAGFEIPSLQRLIIIFFESSGSDNYLDSTNITTTTNIIGTIAVKKKMDK